jgi:hypothetical protein
MQSSTTTLRDTPGVISELELRRLLIELKEKRPDICVRYRLLGEMWAQHFMRVLQVTEKGVMLNDEASNKLVIVTNLANIMQFELDNRFQNFQPFFHYEVIPSQE